MIVQSAAVCLMSAGILVGGTNHTTEVQPTSETGYAFLVARPALPPGGLTVRVVPETSQLTDATLAAIRQLRVAGLDVRPTESDTADVTVGDFPAICPTDKPDVIGSSSPRYRAIDGYTEMQGGRVTLCGRGWTYDDPSGIVAHELGHIVGLDHSGAFDGVVQVMAAEDGAKRYQTGDLVGLRLIAADSAALSQAEVDH